MIQRIAPWARSRRTLDAITHDAVTLTSQYENYFRQETGWSGLLYTSGMRTTPTGSPGSICPHPATCAAQCGPVRLCAGIRDGRAGRRPEDRSARASPALLLERDQHNGRPYSSKALRECYRQGAEAFGWQKRNPAPRAMRDGGELVGWGMASGVWDAFQVPITVRIRLTANGHAEVACAASDIGTGTYTIMAQVAADMLGLPLDSVSVKLGDSPCRNRRSRADHGSRPRSPTASPGRRMRSARSCCAWHS
jgi:Aerobic-type carbon monoxide dehydrogenase, large subunit CoxL/CutL homologs